SSYGGGDTANALERLIKADQQAPLVKEQTRAERLANRRRLFDEYLYERDKTPTAEEERRRHEADQLQHALSNPSVTEIWSGQALNAILADLRKLAGPSGFANVGLTPISLGEEELKHINVTRGVGNIGLLKSSGPLDWPAALLDVDYEPERSRLRLMAQQALQVIKAENRVAPAFIAQMTGDLEQLHQRLRSKSAT